MDQLLKSEMQQAATALRENRVSEAILQLQGVREKSPDDFNVNHMLGVALGKAGRGSESIALLLKATQLNPNHVAARTHLGLAYVAADKPELARQAFQAALKNDPHFAPAQQGLDKLPAPIAKAPKVPAQVAPLPSAPVQPVATMATNDDDQVATMVKEMAKPSKPKQEVDWASITLLGLGAIFVVGGIYLNFVTEMGMHPYRWFGRIGIIIGVSMFKAGMPSSPNDWKNDF